jgi:hypothetical protein
MKPAIAALMVLATTQLACATRDDDYLLLRRMAPPPGKPAVTQLATPAASDAEAYYVRHLLASGFGAELLRTYAMTKRFAAHASGYLDTPTTIALGVRDAVGADAPPRRVQLGWWRTTIAGEAPIIWIDDSPRRGDRSTMADLVVAFGDAIVDVIAPEPGGAAAGTAPLRDGYVAFLQTVAAEWRAPAAIDDRDELRRLGPGARVRANDAVLVDGAPGSRWVMRGRPARPGQDIIADRLVIATVLYRLATSDLGTRMADPAVYRHFVEANPPRDVHPALLLGAFRNFQAKLLSAWSRAAASRRPPHDLVDLVEAYADAYPAERAETTRIFLVTTYGATALANGVRADDAPDRVESELAVLTADVLFGRRGLRDGLGGAR